jgi:hypothetical protein
MKFSIYISCLPRASNKLTYMIRPKQKLKINLLPFEGFEYFVLAEPNISHTLSYLVGLRFVSELGGQMSSEVFHGFP